MIFSIPTPGDIKLSPAGSITLYAGILNNEKNKDGYESFIIIVYENDLYKWTAEKTGISYIRVSVEKKEPKIDILEKIAEKSRVNECEEYGDFPF